MSAVIKTYQVYLIEDDMKRLREKSGKSSHKDALTEAVQHYLACGGAGKHGNE